MIAASGFLSSSSSYWFEYHQRACIGSSRNTFTGKSSAPLGSKAGNSSWSSTTEFPHPQNYPYLIFWIWKSLLLLPFHQICMQGMVVLYSSLCSHRSMHGLCPAPWLRLPSLPTPNWTTRPVRARIPDGVVTGQRRLSQTNRSHFLSLFCMVII